MLKYIVFLALALAAPARAAAQPSAAPEGLWTRADGRVTFTTARISFPERVGPVAFEGALEFSRPGQGVDNGLQFASPDRQLFATAYVYLPGLAHAGLAAFMTDQAILSQGAAVREQGSAGSLQEAAIRKDYSRFRGQLASSAAIVKAGRWIVKLRVSGPEEQGDQVREAMSALLDGIRFEGEVQPRPAAPLNVEECRSEQGPARALATSSEQMILATLAAGMDGGGEEAKDDAGGPAETLPGRVGRDWCLSTRLRVGEGSYSVLRASQDTEAAGPFGSSVLLVPMNDAGTTLEMIEVERGARFLLLFHEIGRTALLGTYDRPLADSQVAEILSGADREGSRIRASIDILPNGNTNINVPAEAEPPPVT